MHELHGKNVKALVGLDREDPRQVGVVQGGVESQLLQKLRFGGVFLSRRPLQKQQGGGLPPLNVGCLVKAPPVRQPVSGEN